jgi:hypothetical protein
MSTQDADRRKSHRELHEREVVVKVIASTTGAVKPGRTFRCASHDISNEGLRLKTTEPLVGDAYLEMWIVSPFMRETLILRGIVRWSREIGPSHHAAGIELIPDSAANITAWRDLVSAVVADGNAPAAGVAEA